jgi:catechol 2,3-dioxygenase-like lactoylglutathione lyase family enzyme
MPPYWTRSITPAATPAARLARSFHVQFAYTIVYVRDVAASLQFFERAFGLKQRFLHESGGYGELETGTTALAFAQHEVARGNLGHDYVAADTSKAPLGVEIGLTTDDVAAACDRAVAAGARLLAAPAAKPWGQVVAYLRTPDGTLVELCTAMG